VEGQQNQSPFVLSNSPESSEADYNFDIEETETWMQEQANLRKQQEENRKKLARMTEALGSAEEEAQIDEEIQRLRQEFNATYSELSRNLSNSVPDSLLFSGRPSPITA